MVKKQQKKALGTPKPAATPPAGGRARRSPAAGDADVAKLQTEGVANRAMLREKDKQIRRLKEQLQAKEAAKAKAKTRAAPKET